MQTTDITAFVDGIVHEPTQAEGPGVDLTVTEIYEITTPGRVDFGGGELESADSEPHPSAKRNPGDDYEWWTLDAGRYLVEYNQSLTGDATVTLQTRRELLERGVSHPTIHVESLPQVPLSVGGTGVKIKQNARVSTIVDAD